MLGIIGTEEGDISHGGGGGQFGFGYVWFLGIYRTPRLVGPTGSKLVYLEETWVGYIVSAFRRKFNTREWMDHLRRRYAIKEKQSGSS